MSTYTSAVEDAIKKASLYADYLKDVSGKWSLAKEHFKDKIDAFNTATGSDIVLDNRADPIPKQANGIVPGFQRALEYNLEMFTDLPFSEDEGVSIYEWLTNFFGNFQGYTGVINGQQLINPVTKPTTFEAKKIELKKVEVFNITAPVIRSVPDMPETPVEPVGINQPEKVYPAATPGTLAPAPAPASIKTIVDIQGIDLPMLTIKHASTPPDSIVELGTSEDVSNVELNSDEAEGSIKPEAPVELNDFEDVTNVDPLEPPKELEKAPEVEEPIIPGLTAPETVDPAAPPVEQPIELTAPTEPKTLEAPVAGKQSEAPLSLLAPKKEEEEKILPMTASSKTNTVADPSKSKLPNTRSGRRLPNTGSETSSMGQGMGAFMAGAAGSLLFWKRKKGKHSK
ncbi:LPXTG cell wall anchor domain-containing protein [Enterococcus ureasiticus]|uniref:LPXTG cell wall anchor domain-containing protein n=1 Tax=Enterococcus ureasiticus TaxID=903984 RepID=UPI0030FABC72